jgi:DNA-binding PadR family transcriptional regulator
MEEEQNLAKQRLETYRMGRKRRGDIRIFLLWALRQQAMHGYELIKFLTEKSYGLWVPSPGSVYPTLEMLEQQGLIQSVETNGKKIYTITQLGRQEQLNMEEGGFSNDPEQLDAIKSLRESNMIVRRIMRAIITRGSVADLQATAEIMMDTRAKLIKVFGGLPDKNPFN